MNSPLARAALHPPERMAGARVTLRRARPADAEAHFLCADDAETMRHMNWPSPKSPADVRAYLETAELAWSGGREHAWAIERVSDGAFMGITSVEVQVPLEAPFAVEFGYLLGRRYWGQGLAFDALGLLLGWLKAQPGLERIFATAHVDNLRSLKLLERLGLQREGVMRRAVLRPNLGHGPVARDAVLLSLVRGDPGW